MNTVNLLAITSTLLIYIMLAFAYFGWGRLVASQLYVKNQKDSSITSKIWIGWASCLLIFQIIHFILPLTAFSVIPVFLIGVFSSLVHIVKQKNFYFKIFLKQTGFILLSVLIISIWIASHSMLPATQYDAGLYHLNTIKWINSYPTVPGLGNLHGRFAFNQSFLTYVAALNFFPYFNYGRSIANSFLWILSLITIIELLQPIIKQPALIVRSHPYLYIPSFFVIPVLIYLAFTSNGLASPNPDLTSTLLQLLMFIILSHSLGKWIQGDHQQNNTAIFLAILAATAITIKLSNLIFSLTIVAIILVYLVHKNYPRPPMLIRTFFPVSLIIAVFIIRGFILSGAPLFPSTIGYGWIEVDWAVPIEKIINEANWIYSWARQPGVHWNIVLGNWAWFQPWLDTIVNDHFMEVVYPLMLTIVFYGITIALISFRKLKMFQAAEMFILFPSIFSLLFWFFTAPDLRFANQLVLLMFLSSFLLLISCIQSIVSTKKLVIITVTMLVLGNLYFILYLYNNPEVITKVITKVSLSGWHADKKVPLLKKSTKSGLIIYMPEKNNQCWDSPIPCTPYHNKNLRLRIKDDISSGFTVKPKSERNKTN